MTLPLYNWVFMRQIIDYCLKDRTAGIWHKLMSFKLWSSVSILCLKVLEWTETDTKVTFTLKSKCKFFKKKLIFSKKNYFFKKKYFFQKNIKQVYNCKIKKCSLKVFKCFFNNKKVIFKSSIVNLHFWIIGHCK